MIIKRMQFEWETKNVFQFCFYLIFWVLVYISKLFLFKIHHENSTQTQQMKIIKVAKINK